MVFEKTRNEYSCLRFIFFWMVRSRWMQSDRNQNSVQDGETEYEISLQRVDVVWLRGVFMVGYS